MRCAISHASAAFLQLQSLRLPLACAHFFLFTADDSELGLSPALVKSAVTVTDVAHAFRSWLRLQIPAREPQAAPVPTSYFPLMDGSIVALPWSCPTHQLSDVTDCASIPVTRLFQVSLPSLDNTQASKPSSATVTATAATSPLNPPASSSSTKDSSPHVRVSTVPSFLLLAANIHSAVPSLDICVSATATVGTTVATLASTPTTIDITLGNPRTFSATPDPLVMLKARPLTDIGAAETPTTAITSHISTCIVPWATCVRSIAGIFAPSGLLVHGLPGVGKSSILAAVARSLRTVTDATVLPVHTVWLSCGSLTALTVSQLRTRLTRACQEACRRRPSLIVFDDIDLLMPAVDTAGPDTHGALRVTQRVEAFVDVLATARTAMEQPNKPGVALVASARSVTSFHATLQLPPLFCSRVEIPAPNALQRATIVCTLLRRMHLHAEFDTDAVAAECDGYTGRDLQQLVDRMHHAATVRQWTEHAALVAAARPVAFVGFESAPITSPSHAQVAAAVPVEPASDHIAAGATAGYRTSPVYVSEADVAQARAGFVPAALKDLPLQSSTVSWSDIGGLHDVRAVLKETLELPTKYARLFANAPMKLRSGLLLYGPPVR